MSGVIDGDFDDEESMQIVAWREAKNPHSVGAAFSARIFRPETVKRLHRPNELADPDAAEKTRKYTRESSDCLGEYFHRCRTKKPARHVAGVSRQSDRTREHVRPHVGNGAGI